MSETIWFDPSQCLIGGVWQAPATGQTLPLVNPSHGTVLCQIARGTSDDVDAAVAAARAALDGEWGA
jgi:aldehyde dehydrogenase (NAD+)